MTLSDRCYRRFERRLRRLRATYESLANRHDVAACELSQSREDQSDDLALSNALEQGTLDLLSRDLSIISEIDDALDRIEDGDYGTCQLCGFGINSSRLTVLPYARHCVRCETWLSDRRDAGHGYAG